jgi:hypothetical protein
MKKKRGVSARWVSLVLVLLVAMVGGAAAAMAISGGPYGVTWSTIGGGGGSSVGGGYRLEGTAAQPDPGDMVGNGYRLEGGFWSGWWVGYLVYLPVVTK